MKIRYNIIILKKMINMILEENKYSEYGPRTLHNADSAHLTVAFAEDYHTKGEQLTKRAAKDRYIRVPLNLDPVVAARLLYKRCKDDQVKILNIAGNGIYTLNKYNWEQESVNKWVYDVLTLVHKHYPLLKVLSGGQTGVDFAGGVAAEALGIYNVMTFPKGYRQRNEEGKEVYQTKQEVYDKAMVFVNNLKKSQPIQVPKKTPRPKI